MMGIVYTSKKTKLEIEQNDLMIVPNQSPLELTVMLAD
jgi:hypothetical protein